jgi:AcrR family transcriptional regulator
VDLEQQLTAGAGAEPGGKRPGRPRREDVGPESTRDRIVRLATGLFAARGFDATGVQEISAVADVGRGALYHHFRSKQHLLFEIVMDTVTRVDARAAEIVDGPGTSESRLAALAEALVVELAERREAHRVGFRDWRSLNPDQVAAVVVARGRYEDRWRTVLAQGAEEGRWRPVDDVLVRVTVGMFAATHEWVRADGPVSPPDLARRMIDLLLGGLRNLPG